MAVATAMVICIRALSRCGIRLICVPKSLAIVPGDDQAVSPKSPMMSSFAFHIAGHEEWSETVFEICLFLHQMQAQCHTMRPSSGSYISTGAGSVRPSLATPRRSVQLACIVCLFFSPGLSFHGSSESYSLLGSSMRFIVSLGRPPCSLSAIASAPGLTRESKDVESLLIASVDRASSIGFFSCDEVVRCGTEVAFDEPLPDLELLEACLVYESAPLMDRAPHVSL